MNKFIAIICLSLHFASVNGMDHIWSTTKKVIETTVSVLDSRVTKSLAGGIAVGTLLYSCKSDARATKSIIGGITTGVLLYTLTDEEQINEVPSEIPNNAYGKQNYGAMQLYGGNFFADDLPPRYNEELYGRNINYGTATHYTDTRTIYHNNYYNNRADEVIETYHYQSPETVTHNNFSDTYENNLSATENTYENWRTTMDDDTSNAYEGLGNPWERHDSDDD